MLRSHHTRETFREIMEKPAARAALGLMMGRASLTFPRRGDIYHARSPVARPLVWLCARGRDLLLDSLKCSHAEAHTMTLQIQMLAASAVALPRLLTSGGCSGPRWATDSCTDPPDFWPD